MPNSLRHQQIKVRQGAYLPHWTLEGAIYHVVFRLADSLPAEAVARFRSERDALLTADKTNKGNDADQVTRLRILFGQRIEALLDNGLGACWFAREDIASLMAGTLEHFIETRYALHAWCIMPNHVHAIVQPRAGQELSAILKSWKGYVAHEANRKLGRAGEFWQPEYYDHVIRNEAELAETVRYVQLNPNQAGLTNWRWVCPPLA